MILAMFIIIIKVKKMIIIVIPSQIQDRINLVVHKVVNVTNIIIDLFKHVKKD